MQFSHHTLRSTSERFGKALKARGLSLSFSAELNVWAQIVVGKDFSAAAAHANAQGYISAVPITADTIRAKLLGRSRDIDSNVARELFAEAICEDLSELSYCMSELVNFITVSEQSCLIGVFSDSSRLGIMDAMNPGYLPVSKMKFAQGREQDMAWLRASSELVVEVVNALAGVGKNRSADIYAANYRVQGEKMDKAFAHYYGQRVESCSRSLAEEILAEFDPTRAKDWDVIDFDTVRDIVYDVIEKELRKRRESWLNPDCKLGEAMIDHLAVRIRETLKWLSDQANDGDDHDSPIEAVAQTAALSMQKMLNVQQFSR